MENISYKSLVFKTSVLKVLLVLICILYFLFLYIDIFNVRTSISSDNIKYICIILCFIISLMTGKDSFNRRDVLLLQGGLFFTVLADLCLLIRDYFTLGVVFFSIVQILYSIRYEFTKVKLTLLRFIAISYIVIIVYLMVNFWIIEFDLLFAVVFFYLLCLITSITRAIKACKNNIYPSPNKYMIILAMLLFLLGDINVGLYNIARLINLSGELPTLLNNTSGLLIWIFYLPSQVLLSLSGYRFYSTR
ncbi:MAG: lysoplasmalogenase family protein [Clostridiaceae bacterium]